MVKVTNIQFARALKLAKKFHHAWGLEYEILVARGLFSEAEAGVSFDPGLLADNCRQLGTPGIVPVMDGEKIIHVTGTGRLMWEIHPNGRVVVKVSRPGGAALTMTVFEAERAGPCRPDRPVDPDSDIRIEKEDAYCTRHLEVLQDVIVALGHYSHIVRVLAPWYGGAEDSYVPEDLQ